MGRINLKDLDRYKEQSQKPQKIKKRKPKVESDQPTTVNKN
tara:strand:+ start:783 stop:905 length:123 start_codon:yes stop_codon:yes gene_type:complete